MRRFVTAMALALGWGTVGWADDHAAKEAALGAAAGAAGAACRLVEFHGDEPLLSGTLSPFWAQELVGQPYIAPALSRFRESGGAFRQPRFGIIDGGMRLSGLTAGVTEDGKRGFEVEGKRVDTLGDNPRHGTSVGNLIFGRAPHGYGVGQLGAFFYNRLEQEDALAAMWAANVDAVNVSQSWSRTAHEKMRELSRRSILVFSAGNRYPMPAHYFPGKTTPEEAAAIVGQASGVTPLGAAAPTLAQYPDVISVGSISPRGLPSYFSQEGPAVTIVAPSDDLISTSNGKTTERFGGTSGAAPLVTGVAGIGRGILPGLTGAELSTILQRTAIPVLGSSGGTGKNGAGMLNAYKATEVFIRLARRGWPRDREKLLADPSIYEFSGLGKEEAELDVESLFRRGRDLLGERDCDQQRRGFGLVQRAFLLSAGSSTETSRRILDQSRRLLANRLDEIGLTANADFYRALNRQGAERVVASRMGREPGRSGRSLARALEILGPEATDRVMREALASREDKVIAGAIDLLPFLSSGLQYLRLAMADRRPAVRARAVATTLAFGDQGRALAQAAARDPEPAVRLAVVRLESRKSGSEGRRLLEQLARDEDREVRRAAAEALRELDAPAEGMGEAGDNGR